MAADGPQELAAVASGARPTADLGERSPPDPAREFSHGGTDPGLAWFEDPLLRQRALDAFPSLLVRNQTDFQNRRARDQEFQRRLVDFLSRTDRRVDAYDDLRPEQFAGFKHDLAADAVSLLKRLEQRVEELEANELTESRWRECQEDPLAFPPDAVLRSLGRDASGLSFQESLLLADARRRALLAYIAVDGEYRVARYAWSAVKIELGLSAATAEPIDAMPPLLHQLRDRRERVIQEYLDQLRDLGDD